MEKRQTLVIHTESKKEEFHFNYYFFMFVVALCELSIFSGKILQILRINK